MGIYLNPGAGKLQQSRNSEIYVDKSGMLKYLNHVINTEQRFVCVSRPQRFGKSMSANLISAYYDHNVDGRMLFHGMQIESDESFWQVAEWRLTAVPLSMIWLPFIVLMMSLLCWYT